MLEFRENAEFAKTLIETKPNQFQTILETLNTFLSQDVVSIEDQLEFSKKIYNIYYSATLNVRRINYTNTDYLGIKD